MKYEKAIKKRLRLIESAMKELRTLNDLASSEQISEVDIRILHGMWGELMAAKYALESVKGTCPWPQHLSVLAARRLAKEIASRSCAEPGKAAGAVVEMRKRKGGGGR